MSKAKFEVETLFTTDSEQVRDSKTREATHVKCWVEVGGIEIFERTYPMWTRDQDPWEITYDEDEARDAMLAEFGDKLRQVIDDSD